MNELKEICSQQLEQLDNLIYECKNHLKQLPKGTLRISCQKNIPRYYWKHSQTTTQGIYIRRNNLDLARQLAQKNYIEQLLHEALQQRKYLLEFMEQYNWDAVAQLHNNLSTHRQSLISPMILSDDEYAENWEQHSLLERDTIKSLHSYHHYTIEEGSGFLTEKGDLVRSKSEKIIADKLFKMNIPYIYEMPILLKTTKYFTLISHC